MATSITQEIAQQMVQECLARRLRQVNRMVTRLYDDALRDLGLTVNQLNIIATIVSQGSLQPGHLGQLLGMEKSTVSRTVDRMVKRGWLAVGPGKDGRSQRLSATPAGQNLLRQAAPIWDELQDQALGAMGNGGLLASLGFQAASDSPPSEANEADDSDFYASDNDWANDFYA